MLANCWLNTSVDFNWVQSNGANWGYYLVKHQPLAGVEADSKAPFLPAHLVAVDLKAGAFRLSDLKRLVERT